METLKYTYKTMECEVKVGDRVVLEIDSERADGTFEVMNITSQTVSFRDKQKITRLYVTSPDCIWNIEPLGVIACISVMSSPII